MELMKVLEDEAISQFSGISSMELGEDATKVAINGASEITKNIIDLQKVENERMKIEYEHEEKLRAQEIEIHKIETEKQDQKIKNRISIAGIAVPTVVGILTYAVSTIVEQTGSITLTAAKDTLKALGSNALKMVRRN